MSRISCKLCGRTLDEGAYLKCTSPKGGAFEGVCHPACDVSWISENAKLIDALTDTSDAARREPKP